MKLIEIDEGHSLWPITSRFIRSMYDKCYNARIVQIPKRVVALVDPDFRVHCAAGLRDSLEPFFSEYYLDEPVEMTIGALSGSRVERREIVEVSSFASRTPGSSVRFISELVSYGEGLGFNWAFFTTTSRLRKVLHRTRLPLIDLGVARSSRVPSPELWGSYYQTNPKVLAIGRRDLAPFLSGRRVAVHPAEGPIHV